MLDDVSPGHLPSDDEELVHDLLCLDSVGHVLGLHNVLRVTCNQKSAGEHLLLGHCKTFCAVFGPWCSL